MRNNFFFTVYRKYNNPEKKGGERRKKNISPREFFFHQQQQQQQQKKKMQTTTRKRSRKEEAGGEAGEQWSDDINNKQKQQYYTDSIDIFTFVKHEREKKTCECSNCTTTTTSINTLLSNIWHSYPFKSIGKTKPEFKKTLLDTPPDKFILETYLHGSPNRKCFLTGMICMSYMILKIPLEQQQQSSKKPQCCNCGGLLDCVNSGSSFSVADDDDPATATVETEFVIDYKYGKLLPAIRFLANIKQFTQQTPVKMIDTVSTNITTSYNELRCRIKDT